MSTIIDLVRAWFHLTRSSRARPFLLIALFVDSAFLFVFLVAIQSYLPEQHGGGVALPGYTLAAYGVAKLNAQLFAGRLSDRLGAARAAQVGLAIIALGQAALLSAIAVPMAVLPAAAVYGFGSAVLWPALYAGASNRFTQDERARLGASLTVTSGIALIIALGLGLVLPAGFPFAAAAVIALASVSLAALASMRLRSSLPEPADSAQEPGDASLRAVVATALDTRRLGFAVFVFLESAAIGSLQAIFRSYGRDLLGVSFRRELIFLAPAALFAALAIVLGGALADRLGRRLPLSAGFLTAGIAIWLLSGVTQPGALIPLAAFAGFAAGLAMPSMAALSMDLSRTAGQGTVLAWFMMMEGLGHAGGAGLGGWLNSAFDPSAVLRLAAVLFASIGIASLVSLGWPRLSGANAWEAPAEALAGWASDTRSGE